MVEKPSERSPHGLAGDCCAGHRGPADKTRQEGKQVVPLCPAPVAPPHNFISFYLCLCEEVTVGRPWVKGGLNVNSDPERLSNFLEVTQLMWAELSLHPKSLRFGTTPDFKGW